MQNDKEKFINKIKVQLELCNYGFQVEKNSYNIDNGYSPFETRNMKAIKELMIRLNVWKATGKLDKGVIDYPEANRKIIYHLHPTDINKCKVNLLKN